jgi:membrane dipeptidase
MNSNGWTRREFFALTGSAIFATALPRWADATQPTAAGPSRAAPAILKASSSASKLYDNAFVLDANTLASIGYTQFESDSAAQLKTIKRSGLTALKSTMGGDSASFEQTVADIAAAQSLIEKHPDLFLKVTGPGDLERAKPQDKMAIILSFEAASMLEGKIDRIELFRQLDVLVMQLSYNRRSPFGCGCLDGDTEGVTPLGRQAIAKMNSIGVALDLSHANAQTTADGIALSKKPAVITHAGCRAVYDHPRNKTDRDMKALADKGGVMGIYMLPFLTPDNRQPMLADYLAHLTHALNVCGEDHVGIGTDSLFFQATGEDIKAIAAQEDARRKAGIGAPGENRPPYIPDINTPRKLQLVTDAMLKKGYGERTIEKVLGLNFRRVFEEIWSV